VNRVLGAVVVASVVFSPVAVAASPTPSPSLDTVLVAPMGTGFVDDPSALSFPEGTFTAPQWAAVAGTDAPAVEAHLKTFGFITGYARAWLDKAHNHRIVQIVVALGGGQGARNLQSYLSANVTGNKYYSRSISVSGIDTSGGAHFADPATPGYADEIWFTKGNDFFDLTVAAVADDMGDLAVTEAKRQFDVAPSSTIPPDQWPENSSSGGFDWAGITGRVAVIAVVVTAVAVVIVVTAVVLLSRRRAASATAYVPVSAGVQMSGDGNYWWDGAGWRDASREAPPTAQRSGDGYYWWDGRAWRPVPR
jgi:hypothetical protein